MRADLHKAMTLRRILLDYCDSSGQMVSEAKSSIFFSPNTGVDARVEVCSELNSLTEAVTDKYLGLPPLIGMDITDCFFFCILLIEWLPNKEKLLSYGGKEVLLKAVIQAIPAYAMYVFKLPKLVIKGITYAMSRY
jgi:hypothetical protein